MTSGHGVRAVRALKVYCPIDREALAPLMRGELPTAAQAGAFPRAGDVFFISPKVLAPGFFGRWNPVASPAQKSSHLPSGFQMWWIIASDSHAPGADSHT